MKQGLRFFLGIILFTSLSFGVSRYLYAADNIIDELLERGMYLNADLSYNNSPGHEFTFLVFKPNIGGNPQVTEPVHGFGASPVEAIKAALSKSKSKWNLNVDEPNLDLCFSNSKVKDLLKEARFMFSFEKDIKGKRCVVLRIFYKDGRKREKYSADSYQKVTTALLNVKDPPKCRIFHIPAPGVRQRFVLPLPKPPILKGEEAKAVPYSLAERHKARLRIWEDRPSVSPMISQRLDSGKVSPPLSTDSTDNSKNANPSTNKSGSAK